MLDYERRPYCEQLTFPKEDSLANSYHWGSDIGAASLNLAPLYIFTLEKKIILGLRIIVSNSLLLV